MPDSSLLPDFSKLRDIDIGALIVKLAQDLNLAKDNPAVEKLLRLIADPTAREALAQMAAKPDRKHLIIYEAVFIAMMFILRNYEYSRLQPGQFGRRIWISLWTGLLNIVGIGFLVPFIFFGRPYLDFLRALLRVLTT